ncbi:heme acquisition protein HasA [Pseudomonas putida]
MSISVSYKPELGASKISDYLQGWEAGFVTAGHGAGATGGFNTSSMILPPTTGDQYATASKTSNYAMIAESDTADGLNYVFKMFGAESPNMNHYLWGDLDNVQLGQKLSGGKGVDFTLAENNVSFNGLNLSAPDGAGREGNPVQEVVYGLMKGNPDPLEATLNKLLAEYNLSTAATFDQVAAAAPVAAPVAMPNLVVANADQSWWDWAFAA